MYSVTSETAVAAASQATRSKQAPTSQPSQTDGFAALVDGNTAAAADHDRPASDDRQPRTGVSTDHKARNDNPPKTDTASNTADQGSSVPAGSDPATQDAAQTTKPSTGVVPGSKPGVVIKPGKSNNGTDQDAGDQTALDGQAAQTAANTVILSTGPVAVVIPVSASADASATPATGDTAVASSANSSTVIVPADSLAAAAIANASAAASATETSGETATPATTTGAETKSDATTARNIAAANAAATAATTAATSSQPDPTVAAVDADAAVTLAAAAPAAVAVTTKSATTPAAIQMAGDAKAGDAKTDAAPAATSPLTQAAIDPAASDNKTTAHDPKQDAVEAKTDAPANDTDARKPVATRDGAPAIASHDHRAASSPSIQPDPSLQAAANAPQPTQIQPVNNVAIPTAQLSVALATNMPVPLNGLAVDIALKAASGKSRFEIRLDPADLGRIDVRLDVDKHGQVTSHLTVEKPSTLDMLRRDAPQLQRALEDAGLKTGDSGLQFSLRDQSSGRNDDNGSGRHAHRLVITEDDAIPAPVAGKTYSRMLGASSGVDIRI